MTDCCNCACETPRKTRPPFERVLYAPADDCQVYTDQDDLVDSAGQLVAVYTLSHIARVEVEPERAVLRIVEIV